MSNCYRLSGPIVLSTVTQLAEQSRPQLTHSPLEIDFSAVSEVDSTAISLMLHWRRHALTTGQELRFTHLPPSLLSLAQLYGVELLLK